VIPVSAARRVARVVWTSLVFLPVAFLAVAFAVRPGGSESPALTALLFWIAITGSAFDIALSRLLPPGLGSASTSADTVTFTRLLVAWALCEAAALFPLVAFIVTRDPRLLGVFAVDLLALVLLYPSDLRWESLAPATPWVGPQPRRMVR
jgi:drug/metabolite transporter (DMT)-like permease